MFSLVAPLVSFRNSSDQRLADREATSLVDGLHRLRIAESAPASVLMISLLPALMISRLHRRFPSPTARCHSGGFLHGLV